MSAEEIEEHMLVEELRRLSIPSRPAEERFPEQRVEPLKQAMGEIMKTAAMRML